jgi:hypothetical protein
LPSGKWWAWRNGSAGARRTISRRARALFSCSDVRPGPHWLAASPSSPHSASARPRPPASVSNRSDPSAHLVTEVSDRHGGSVVPARPGCPLPLGGFERQTQGIYEEFAALLRVGGDRATVETNWTCTAGPPGSISARRNPAYGTPQRHRISVLVYPSAV